MTSRSRRQTVAQELIDSGALERTVALRTPWANVLSSALGGSTSEPSVTCIENDWSNVHLLAATASRGTCRTSASANGCSR